MTEFKQTPQRGARLHGVTRTPRWDSLPQKEHVLLYTSDQPEPEKFHFSLYLCRRRPVEMASLLRLTENINKNLVSELEDETKKDCRLKRMSLLAGPSLINNPLPPS